MSATNAIVAATLRRYAGVLATERANRFKIKAYQKAADTIDQLDQDVSEMVAAGQPLTSLPGVGEGLSGVIEEIVQTGHLKLLDRSLSDLSPDLLEISTRPGLDPQRVLRVYKKLGIHSLKELREALDSGRLNELDRRTAFHIRQGLSARRYLLLWDADKLASPMLKFLQALSDVERVATVGSVRRRSEIVGDINFLAQTRRPANVFKRFEKFGGLKRLTSHTTGVARYELSTGFQITVTACREKDWAASVITHTGSIEHVRQLEKHAVSCRRLVHAFADADDPEKNAYGHWGLPFIPPELREGQGEIAAAAKNQLPELVQLSDLCGDLHMHTHGSDGANTLEEMATAAIARGYRYIAITDHSQSLKITNGLSPERLLAQCQRIDEFNEQQTEIRILKSAEVDILEDGSLDYPDKVLKRLDFTICSIHSRFSLGKQKQTDRIRRAMDHPYFTILGHPTGRLLLKREGYELDMEMLLQHAATIGCFVEINSSPDRLDLNAEHAHMAKELGIKIAVNTDAHRVRELQFITAGLNQARRAWLEPKDILNTLELPHLLAFLQQRRKPRRRRPKRTPSKIF